MWCVWCVIVCDNYKIYSEQAEAKRGYNGQADRDGYMRWEDGIR